MCTRLSELKEHGQYYICSISLYQGTGWPKKLHHVWNLKSCLDPKTVFLPSTELTTPQHLGSKSHFSGAAPPTSPEEGLGPWRGWRGCV